MNVIVAHLPDHGHDEPPVELMRVSYPEGKAGELGDNLLKANLDALKDDADAPAMLDSSPATEGFSRVAEDATPAELANVLRSYYLKENDPSLRNGGKARRLPLGLAAIRLSKDLRIMTPQQHAIALDEYMRQEGRRTVVSDNPAPRELDWAERAANDDRLD